MDSSMTFWQHLDALRSVIIRMALTITVAGVVMFIAMPWIFDHIILWPCRDDFPLYRLFDMSAVTGETAGKPFSVSLININLGSQLMVQMSTSMHLALVVTFPALIVMLWSFVSPGLYPREKRHAWRAFLFATTMFYLGVATAYIMVFPITLRFLSQYQLSGLITNTITLDSYIDNFMTITLIMGILFELPMLAWLLGKIGILDRSFFSRYRRHAIVILLVLAALITPTGDPFSLFVVFAPLYLLWELSAYLVPAATKSDSKAPVPE